jgi:hypothetical protein
MTQDQLVHAVEFPETVDELLEELDRKSKEYNRHDYGLPLWGEEPKATLREVIYRWLLKQEPPALCVVTITDSGYTYREINAALQKEEIGS